MSQEEQEQMMKLFQEMKTPAPEHKVLEAIVGEWNVLSQMGGPDAPGEGGTCVNKWSESGLFVEMHFNGTMMGGPYSGVGYFGYDKMKKKYNGIWIDSMSSTITTLEGDYDPATKTITYDSMMDNVMTGQMNQQIQYVTRIVDSNKHVFEMHDPSLPADKSMQFRITYTRK